jgi:hypothetical protein
MRKFEGVDVIPALRKIVDNNNLHYKTDYEYDVETLKKAAAGSHFLWLSRYSGTWLMNERDAHIRNTESYNTWQYYTDTKYYGVKAFAVKVTGNDGGRPVGDIYELDYNKHREEVRKNSFSAKTVDVTFKPAHWEKGATPTTRTFEMDEYNNNWGAIISRYGQAESIRHNLSGEDMSQLKEVLAKIRSQRESEAVPADINDYVREMTRGRFHEYGYKRDDMAFTAPDDAYAAFRHLIPVYILYPDNVSEQAKSKADLDNAVYGGCMFGMSERDKKLLNFYKAGNTFDDLPFSKEELKAIFFMALDKGKECLYQAP